MRKPEKTIILYDVNYDEELPVIELISKYLADNYLVEVLIVCDGCLPGWIEAPNGEHFEQDNYSLIIVGNEPFGSGLMAPSIFTYVTDNLCVPGRFFPEKTAVMTQAAMVPLNKLFDSSKFKLFAQDDLVKMAEFFGFGT